MKGKFTPGPYAGPPGGMVPAPETPNLRRAGIQVAVRPFCELRAGTSARNGSRPRSDRTGWRGCRPSRLSLRLDQADGQNVVSKDPRRVVDLDPAAVTLEKLVQRLVALTFGDGPHEVPFSVNHREDKLILTDGHSPGRLNAAIPLLAMLRQRPGF